METIKVYTDGGCSGNPGPGAWAFIILDGRERINGAGRQRATTNNRMELSAVISALEFIAGRPEMKHCPLEVYTDSQYVKKGITEWIHNWVRNGWLTATKKPVKNKEYWLRLKKAADGMKISWHWVMGHAGIDLNEECDRMVKEGIRKLLAK